MVKIVIAAEGGLEGKAAAHFAHCPNFIVFDTKDGKVRKTEIVENPYSSRHVPGAIPEFVRSLGADVVITGGIGPMAITHFEKMNVKVVCGVRGKVTDLVAQYLEGKIKPNENSCSH